MDACSLKLALEGIRLEESVSLSRYSTFRIGGNARVAVFPKTREEFLRTLLSLKKENARFVVIGKGSNILFSDAGFDGVVVFTTDWKEIHQEGNKLTVSAGASLASVASAARDASLGGAEFLHGIPGTVGGAVFMNAGAFGGEIAHICTWSEYFDPQSGKIIRLEGDAQEFGTRSSFYSAHPDVVILGAELELAEDSMENIKSKMKDFSDRRRASQPLDLPSAGSVFKRPTGHFAGKLIEDCGLKGYTIGGARVSEKHAGFIVNCGGATAEDVKTLIGEIQERVYARFGVKLECEIRFL